MTSDPGPGSNGFPTPPSYGPPSYGIGPYGPPPYGYGPVPYGPAPYGPPRPVRPDMLAAAADRERTTDVLKAAFAEGRLSKSEFDERSARVLAARTYGDLHSLTGDLPAGPGGVPLPLPYPAGYYPPTTMAKTNGVAVGALICGFFPFGGIPAIILGHIARGQIRQTGERGDGLAIAGLVLGYLWVSLWMLLLLIRITHP